MDDKIPFYALDLRNISRLGKTETKTRAQCLMVVIPNGQYWVSQNACHKNAMKLGCNVIKEK